MEKKALPLGANTFNQFKKRFLVLTVICITPFLLFTILGFILGLWQLSTILGLLILLVLIISILVILLAYSFFKRVFLPKTG